MHEFSLYGQVPGHEHHRMLQQLAGVTCMQPQQAQEIHLVFRSRTPPALRTDFPAGNASNDKHTETQRIMRLLNTGIHYVQVIGQMRAEQISSTQGEDGKDDVNMTNGEHSRPGNRSRVQWNVEFKDTPEAGKHSLSNRYVARTLVEEGDVMKFMIQFGFDYVSRYLVIGDRFYDQEVTLFLHRVMTIPEADNPEVAVDLGFLDKSEDISPLDGSGGYLLQASIEALEGNNQEVKDRATGQLLAMKETLKQAVDLTPGDRLALDTRVSIIRRV